MVKKNLKLQLLNEKAKISVLHFKNFYVEYPQIFFLITLPCNAFISVFTLMRVNTNASSA